MTRTAPLWIAATAGSTSAELIAEEEKDKDGWIEASAPVKASANARKNAAARCCTARSDSVAGISLSFRERRYAVSRYSYRRLYSPQGPSRRTNSCAGIGECGLDPGRGNRPKAGL